LSAIAEYQPIQCIKQGSWEGWVTIGVAMGGLCEFSLRNADGC
jgi:hypothetical protein